MSRDNFINKPQFFYTLALIGITVFGFNLILLTDVDVRGRISQIGIVDKILGTTHSPSVRTNPASFTTVKIEADLYCSCQTSQGGDPILDSDQEAFEDLDNHPIVKLTNEYLSKFENYKAEQSRTFSEVIIKYRSQYGRNPPPGFDKVCLSCLNTSMVERVANTIVQWYKFAKKKNVVNIDDFAQIHDDLRPFWGIEPHVIRQSIKNLKEDHKSKTIVLHVRHPVTSEGRPLLTRDRFATRV